MEKEIAVCHSGGLMSKMQLNILINSHIQNGVSAMSAIIDVIGGSSCSGGRLIVAWVDVATYRA